LEWEDDKPHEMITEEHPFVDGGGVLLPLKSDAPHTVMVTMGSPAFKINAWYWRADEPTKPRNIVAEGLGTTVTSKKSYLNSGAKWEEGKWKVVIGRTLSLKEQPEEAVQLEVGDRRLISFSVWEGGNKERGGIKAFCACKSELFIEP